MLATMAELTAYLADVQARRADEVRCELTPALTAQFNDAMLAETLVLNLTTVQGIQCRILRCRGRGAILTAKLRYRDGVRMLRGDALNADESAAMAFARSLADEALRIPDEAVRFHYVYDWVCRNIRYVHTAPGRKGYGRLVGAASVLHDRQANCQGFADVVYLLCGLCGIVCEYRCGRGVRQLHVWNAVRIRDEWRDVDASKGAREYGD